MITYKIGDCLETPDRYIAHGCNNIGIMGAGIAKQILKKYPKACSNYFQRFQHNIASSLEGLGDIVIGHEKNKVIFHCITQPSIGYNAKFVSYDAVDQCMYLISRNINERLSDIDRNISMPKIGAGLGGGEWSIIESIIKHRLKDFNVTVWSLGDERQ